MTSNVYIAKNVYGGDGLGRLGDGRVVFVPGAFAGEQVRAEIVEERKGFVKAKLVEIVEPSPNRIGCAPAPVPGMVYSNLKYDAELDAKEEQLAETFSRARISIPSVQRIPCEKHFEGYRNKAIYRFRYSQGEGCVIGYRKERSHELVVFDVDPLVCPEIREAMPEIKKNLVSLLSCGSPRVRRDVEKKETVTVRYTPQSGVKWFLGDDAQGILKEKTRGLVFDVPTGGFYQVNPFAGEALVTAVVDDIKSLGIKEFPLFDLYCGVGVFGIAVASAIGGGVKLKGVEVASLSVKMASDNAKRHNVNAEFQSGAVGRTIKSLGISAKDSIVIVDPPRGGMEKGAPEKLAASGASRIYYVSCDPATLVRDVAKLTCCYDVVAVKWVDMFPRTARFETLVVLKRKA
jgi:23S rRNA (uracil1939-C5)-methyltransferase/tRNA (uracil-5-)-methyltransferase